MKHVLIPTFLTGKYIILLKKLFLPKLMYKFSVILAVFFIEFKRFKYSNKRGYILEEQIILN